MKRKVIALLCIAVLAGAVFTGCGSTEAPANGGQNQQTEEQADNAGDEEVVECELEDGVYVADFDTDSGMFHVNEACEGTGILTVEKGHMTIHISLASKNIVNLYPGTAEEAQQDGAVLLEPTTDPITYSDGYKEDVYGFDVPVPALNEEFDLALIGTKGTWYDHKVSVSNPVPQK